MSIDPQQASGDGKSWDDVAKPDENLFSRPSKNGVNDQLAAAISKTLAQVSQNAMPNSIDRSAIDIVIEVARRFPDAEDLSDLNIATELVFELGVLNLPAPVFRRTIARLSLGVAEQLLSDPKASSHLNRAWLSARTDARLVGP